MYDPVIADLNRYLHQMEEGERLDEAAYKLQEEDGWSDWAIEEYALDPDDEDIDDQLHEIACREVQQSAKEESWG